VGWAFAAIQYFASGSDSSTRGFDHAAGVIVTTLFVITAIPACVLTLMNRAPKTALTLALAFPSALAVLFLTVTIAFS
jgi:apolipoprotein N-acyltransferase